MEIPVYETNNGNCPYLPDRNWITKAFAIDSMAPDLYEYLLNKGWRRSGKIFYRNTCPECSLCIPIRIPVNRFKPSKSQRRAGKRNNDVTVKLSSITYSKEIIDIYTRYSKERHEPDFAFDYDEYMAFLGTSPISSKMVRYFLQDKLIGVSWIDILPQGISSVYFAFDPDFSKRSLGTFSVLIEIDLCKYLQKPWYYLGFYVQHSPKMEYKANFKPHQLLINSTWTEKETVYSNIF